MDNTTTLYLSQFMLLSTAHVLAVILPGPDFAVIISQSVRYGRRIGIITALGIGSGIALHVLYTLFGIGLLLQAHAWAMNTAKLIGAVYLIYLGQALVRAQPSSTPLDEPEVVAINTPKARQAFFRGFLTNATNPKATLFFLAIFTTLVSADTPLLIQSLYGVWLCFVTAMWFTFVALLLSRPRFRHAFLRLGHWFERIMGVFLIVFAIRLLFDGVQT